MSTFHTWHSQQALATLTTLTTLALTLGLAACGGGGGAETTSAAEPTRSSDAKAMQVISPLLADDGSAMPSAPQLVLADPGARTRARLYASSAQAEQIELALKDGVVTVDAECCGAEGVVLTLGIAHGLQAARNLPNRVPFLVRGKDLRQAAAVANRLQEAGHENVWLVTQ